MIAIQVEDNLQCLPAALDVVEDVGVWWGTWWGTGLTIKAGGAPPHLREGSYRPPSDCHCDVPGPPCLPTPEPRLQTFLPSHSLGAPQIAPSPYHSEEQPLTSLFTSLDRSQFLLLNSYT